MKDRYVIFGQTGAHFIKGEYQPKDGESFLKNPIKLPKYPLHYWKLVDNQIVEMNDEEKHISDQLISQKKIETIQQIPIDFDKKIQDKINEIVEKLPQPEKIDIQNILKQIPTPEKIDIKGILDETILPLDKKVHKIVEEIDLHFHNHLDFNQDVEYLKKDLNCFKEYLINTCNRLSEDIGQIDQQLNKDLNTIKIKNLKDIYQLEQKLEEQQKSYIDSIENIYSCLRNIESKLFKFNSAQILTILGLSSTMAIIICAISRFL